MGYIFIVRIECADHEKNLSSAQCKFLFYIVEVTITWILFHCKRFIWNYYGIWTASVQDIESNWKYKLKFQIFIFNFKLFIWQSNYNNCNITCVRFADLIQNGTGGVGKISSGGIGKNFVELELTSQPDKGMFYSIALYGFCRSPIDQSITSGAVPNQDIGWKWNLANNTNTSNQNGIGSQSADNNYTQTGQVNYGWKSPEYNVTNNTDPNLRPGWIIPRNTSVSVIPDNGWNKPINSSYSPFSSDYNNRNNNGNNYRFAPIPPPLILPAGGPPLPNPDVSSNGGPPPNAPYGWNNNLYNSSERQSRYIPWRN